MANTGPLRSFDVYLCGVKGRKIAGTSRRARNIVWVAVERGPFDPRVDPSGDYDSIIHCGTFPAFSKEDAIIQARDTRSPRNGGRRR